MSIDNIDRKFVSAIDKFIADFDAHHPPSRSQQKEINKHQRIAKLRDQSNPDENELEIWQNF